MMHIIIPHDIILKNCVRPIKRKNKFKTQFLFRKHRDTEITNFFRSCKIDNSLGCSLILNTMTRAHTSTPLPSFTRDNESF